MGIRGWCVCLCVLSWSASERNSLLVYIQTGRLKSSSSFCRHHKMTQPELDINVSTKKESLTLNAIQ